MQNKFVKPNETERLVFKKNKNYNKRTLILGLDGTGKSTFAEKYCKDNHLKPVCIDFEDTNFASERILNFEFQRTGHLNTKKYIEIIQTISKDPEIDTLIIDDVGRFFDSIMGNSKGLLKYKERKDNWTEIKETIKKAKINMIYIGQINIEISKDEDVKTSEIIVNLHASCNEKYLCEYENSNFTQKILKYRGHEEYIGKTYANINLEA